MGSTCSRKNPSSSDAIPDPATAVTRVANQRHNLSGRGSADQLAFEQMRRWSGHRDNATSRRRTLTDSRPERRVIQDIPGDEQPRRTVLYRSPARRRDQPAVRQYWRDSWTCIVPGPATLCEAPTEAAAASTAICCVVQALRLTDVICHFTEEPGTMPPLDHLLLKRDAPPPSSREFNAPNDGCWTERP